MSKVISGKNDLYTWCIENKRLDIVNEWLMDANNGLTTHDISRATNKTYWWKCSKCGQIWQACPNSRTRLHGTNCPFCSGKRVIKGENDFATLYPEISKEWNYARNEKEPNEYSPFSSQMVWWKGTCNHEWKDTIGHRTARQSGCPVCYNQIRTSFPEQTIYYYIKKYYPDAINNERDILDGKELDIYIPSKKVAIEYDGQAWHENKEKDEQKNKMCSAKEILLFRVRERLCWFWEETEYLRLIPCESKNIKEIENAVIEILRELGHYESLDINISRDEIKIREQFVKRKQSESLAALYPNIAKEWHPTKNGTITPDMVSCHSSSIVWWRDSLGHEWKARIYSRVNGTGCPYCSKPARLLLTGFNDFETKHPDLAHEWNFDKNSILPSGVLYGSTKKYWWKCPKCGIDYLASPANRHNGTGCPSCGLKNNITSKYKKVQNIDTGEIFKSMKDACEKYNIKSANLSKCCKGIRRTCGGYRWKYVD